MSERADFLLEIGCEDLPAGDLNKALKLLGDAARIHLMGLLGLKYGNIKTFGTSRRLILIIENLDKVIPSYENLFIGPPESSSRDLNGNWNSAALGFLNKHNAEPNEIIIVEDKSGNKKIALKEIIEESRTKDFFANMIWFCLDQISRHQLQKMRWGEYSLSESLGLINNKYKWEKDIFSFSRPIKWFCISFDDQKPEISMLGIGIGNTSFGHRFLAPEPFTITSVEQYLQELSKRYVVLDGEERRKRIREHGDKLAAERHACIVWDDDLLGVVADQVEYPQTLIGEFPAEYAELPRALISATLTGYQKYFPLEDASGKLLPYFLAIYDSSPEAEANVRHGNQSAISARLADAKFFYEHDLNMGLAAMREYLAGRGYLPGIGTVLDKSERLIHLSEYLADEMEKNNPGVVVDREALKKAAEYCKADLESAVVGEKEFAHLQGEMGFHYALAEKLPAITALAIREHYNPRAAGDPPASTTEGRIVALADKLDHLAALAIIGKLPKGGDDPFGARRAAVGIILNLLGLSEQQLKEHTSGNELILKLDTAFYHVHKNIKPSINDIEEEQLLSATLDFIIERFRILAEDLTDLRKDYIRGLVSKYGNKPSSCYKRILILRQALVDFPAWDELAESAKRCRNILEAANRDGIVVVPWNYLSSWSFEFEEEKALAKNAFEIQKKFDEIHGDWPGLSLNDYEVLSRLRYPLHEFFAKVFVMVDDTKVRDNRLGLLKAVYDLLGNIMDFSKIEIVTKKES